MIATETTLSDARQYLADEGEAIMAIIQRVEGKLGRAVISISMEREYAYELPKISKVHLNVNI